ncbi:hypothetical protein DGG96_16120 [Legionella qingyii]|uniref:Uncharacterized protein n=1 Tax=Legionella qingyii TaxID=2184757 RepID=A0A317U001_9GAMM|nr:hypothetical protein DGG96_18485 [Legionella qingyii]PWY54535.1 hypothetical protein DGG96_16120 [Legionella qingyii]
MIRREAVLSDLLTIEQVFTIKNPSLVMLGLLCDTSLLLVFQSNEYGKTVELVTAVCSKMEQTARKAKLKIGVSRIFCKNELGQDTKGRMQKAVMFFLETTLVLIFVMDLVIIRVVGHETKNDVRLSRDLFFCSTVKVVTRLAC